MKITMIIKRRINQINKHVITAITISLVLYISATFIRTYIRFSKRITIPSKTQAELKSLLKCRERNFKPQKEMRSEFWVLKNYVRASHGHVPCHATVTFTTHATVEYLEHVETLVQRWRAPVSLAIHAPGTDFDLAVNSIRYLRNCLNNSDLITELVTFHIFFSYKHTPKAIASPEEIYKQPDCSKTPPYHIPSHETYTQKKHILYPINVARNAARDAAMTHFVLASDVDYFPSPNMVSKFMKMVARNKWLHTTDSASIVFPIATFQMQSNSDLPSTKTELRALLSNSVVDYLSGDANSGVYKNIPDVSKWIYTEESENMEVFSGNRVILKNALWSPIFIGTHKDQHYDERLSFEGQNDRIVQAYIMCVDLGIKFLSLTDAFIVQGRNLKGGRKVSTSVMVKERARFSNLFIRSQMVEIFGTHSNCNL